MREQPWHDGKDCRDGWGVQQADQRAFHTTLRRLPPLVAAASPCRPPPVPLPGHAAACPAVRPLTEEETKNVFEKLHKFMGKNIKALVDRGSGEPHCLRLQKNRVFYVREDMMRRATNVRVVQCTRAAA